MERKVSGRPKYGDLCYYCGKQATQIDHVIPQIMLRQIALSTEDITLEVIRSRILTVYCCGECNCLLSDTFTESLTLKKKLLKDRLRKRYIKILSIPTWYEEELDELGYALRSCVEAGLEKQAFIKRRLKW